MLSTNPSHILIARNSRGHNNPSASLSSPTETHAAASGIFRSSGSPPWLLEECDNDELVTELNLYESDQAIEIDDTFTRRNGRFPGTVKIVVESTTFWWVVLLPVPMVSHANWRLYPPSQGAQGSPVFRFSIFRGRVEWQLARDRSSAINVLCHYHLPTTLHPGRQVQP